MGQDCIQIILELRFEAHLDDGEAVAISSGLDLRLGVLHLQRVDVRFETDADCLIKMVLFLHFEGLRQIHRHSLNEVVIVSSALAQVLAIQLKLLQFIEVGLQLVVTLGFAPLTRENLLSAHLLSELLHQPRLVASVEELFILSVQLTPHFRLCLLIDAVNKFELSCTEPLAH
mgnify:FL=1